VNFIPSDSDFSSSHFFKLLLKGGFNCITFPASLTASSSLGLNFCFEAVIIKIKFVPPLLFDDI